MIRAAAFAFLLLPGPALAQTAADIDCSHRARYVHRIGEARDQGWPREAVEDMVRYDSMTRFVQDALDLLYYDQSVTADVAAEAARRVCLDQHRRAAAGGR